MTALLPPALPFTAPGQRAGRGHGLTKGPLLTLARGAGDTSAEDAMTLRRNRLRYGLHIARVLATSLALAGACGWFISNITEGVIRASGYEMER